MFELPVDTIEATVPVFTDWDDVKDQPVITTTTVTIPKAWAAHLINKEDN
jgi:hypothetical protein